MSFISNGLKRLSAMGFFNGKMNFRFLCNLCLTLQFARNPMFAALAFFLFIFCPGVFAQSEVEGITHSDSFQLVFPDRIYVGDEAELRYQFSSGIDLFADLQKADERPLIPGALPFELETADWSVKKLTVRKSGGDYVVSFIFVPWRPGIIDFPRFDINKAVFGSDTLPLMIDPLPLEVCRIVDSDYVEIGEPKSPMLIPGTTYAVVALVVLVVAFVLGIIKLVSVRKRIINWFALKAGGIKLGKNSRRTRHALKRLLKARPQRDDWEFCCAFQKILRNYFSERYGADFFSIVSAGIARYVDEITCSCLREQSVLAVEEIEALFRRCDYVRFARGSVESRRLPEAMYAACLMNGERKVLVEKALKAIMAIESDKDDKVGKSMKDESADKDRKKPSLFLFFKKKVHGEEPENQ